MNSGNRIYELGTKLGSGGENNCYEIQGSYGEPEMVGKVPNIFGRFWQTLTRKHSGPIAQVRDSIFRVLGMDQIGPNDKLFLDECIQAIGEEELPTLPTQIHRDVITTRSQRIPKKEPYLAISPKIYGIDQKKLSYRDLTDREHGVERMRQLIRLIKAGESLYHKEFGLDLLGAEIVIDAVKIATEIALKGSNKVVSELVTTGRIKLPPVPQEINLPIRNLMKDEQGDREVITLTDIGMHDFSKHGKFKIVTVLINHLAFAALIESIKKANIVHGINGLTAEEIAELDTLHPHIPEIQRFTAKLLVQNLLPEAQFA